MKVQTRNLLLGGAVVLGGALCGWYLFGKSSLGKESQPISREIVIQLLKEQQREYYPVLKCVCSIFRETSAIQEANEMPSRQMRKNMMKQYPKIEEKYNAISQKILEKYGVTEEEAIHACGVTFQDDQEVQSLMKKGWIAFEKACQGIPQEFDAAIPDFLTPEKLLEVHAKLIKKEAEKIREIFEPIDKEGKSFWEDQERVVSFIHSARAEISINDEVKEILEAEGLDAFEEHPQRIVDSALFKYLNGDPEFRTKLLELEKERVSFLEELDKRKIQYSS